MTHKSVLQKQNGMYGVNFNSWIIALLIPEIRQTPEAEVHEQVFLFDNLDVKQHLFLFHASYSTMDKIILH